MKLILLYKYLAGWRSRCPTQRQRTSELTGLWKMACLFECCGSNIIMIKRDLSHNASYRLSILHTSHWDTYYSHDHCTGEGLEAWTEQANCSPSCNWRTQQRCKCRQSGFLGQFPCWEPQQWLSDFSVHSIYLMISLICSSYSAGLRLCFSTSTPLSFQPKWTCAPCGVEGHKVWKVFCEK